MSNQVAKTGARRKAAQSVTESSVKDMAQVLGLTNVQTKVFVSIMNLKDDMRTLFEGGSGSDVTIRCGRREWRLHSALLPIRCPFFRAACQGSFQTEVLAIPKSDSIQEAQTRIIEMNDDDSYALDSMLMFLYTGKYNLTRWRAETGAPSSDIHRLLVVKYHIELVLLADKYDIPDLKELATLCANNAAENMTAEED